MTPRQFIEVRWIACVVASLTLAPSCSRSRGNDSGPKSSQPPIAAVVKVTRRNLANQIEIASEFQPFQEVDIHAKVPGYVKNLYIDWGTHVKTGQLMAVLEVPELEQEVRHDLAAEQRSEQDVARANEDLRRAQSDYVVAHLTYDRLHGVQKAQPDLVAQEEIDVAQGKDREANAESSAAQDQLAAAQHELAAAKATLGKDQALYAYARISAPFEGVVTELDAYTGALLPAGTSTSMNGLALCHLSQNDLLRLVIPVPETAVPGIRIGDAVQVNVSALNKRFPGKVVRFSDRIDLQTRTMHTEVQVKNSDYVLVPGMYASVELPVMQRPNVLAVPVEAVQIKGQGQGTVMVLNAQHQIESRDVTLGLETSTEVEVFSGLQENELVIFGEQSRYRPGETVTPKLTSPPAS
jgi:RND family efflux transporter MFP subunit